MWKGERARDGSAADAMMTFYLSPFLFWAPLLLSTFPFRPIFAPRERHGLKRGKFAGFRPLSRSKQFGEKHSAHYDVVKLSSLHLCRYSFFPSLCLPLSILEAQPPPTHLSLDMGHKSSFLLLLLLLLPPHFPPSQVEKERERTKKRPTRHIPTPPLNFDFRDSA